MSSTPVTVTVWAADQLLEVNRKLAIETVPSLVLSLETASVTLSSPVLSSVTVTVTLSRIPASSSGGGEEPA